jgi:hypothetical protein
LTDLGDRLKEAQVPVLWLLNIQLPVIVGCRIFHIDRSIFLLKKRTWLGTRCIASYYSPLPLQSTIVGLDRVSLNSNGQGPNTETNRTTAFALQKGSSVLSKIKILKALGYLCFKLLTAQALWLLIIPWIALKSPILMPGNKAN